MHTLTASEHGTCTQSLHQNTYICIQSLHQHTCPVITSEHTHTHPTTPQYKAFSCLHLTTSNVYNTHRRIKKKNTITLSAIVFANVHMQHSIAGNFLWHKQHSTGRNAILLYTCLHSNAILSLHHVFLCFYFHFTMYSCVSTFTSPCIVLFLSSLHHVLFCF